MTFSQIFEQNAYSLELTEKMTGKIPSIKLECGICGAFPTSEQEILYLNHNEVCENCVRYEQNYDAIMEEKKGGDR